MSATVHGPYSFKSGMRAHKQNTVDAIHALEPFKCGGSLAGKKGNPGETGQLRGEELERYYLDANAIDFVIFSYSTPIAWHTPSGWFTVAQKFSVSTSQQQSFVRLAISNPDIYNY